MKKLFLLLPFLLISIECKAGSVSGEVERIFPFTDSVGNSVVNFRLKNDSCKLSGSQGNTYWRFKLETEIEKAWYSMLLAAATTGKPIRAGVTDPCDPNKNEYVNYLYQDY